MIRIKQLTIIIGIIGIIILIPLIFPECNSFCNSTSTDNKNIIIVKASDPFLFGPSSITIISKKNNLLGILNQSKYKTAIYNDGGSLSSSNIEITWIDNNNAKIILDGHKQNPEEIEVTFDKEIKYNK